MNKKDEIGNRIGYWEEHSYKTVSKGNYVNGHKQGKWITHWDDYLDYIALYKDNKAIYFKTWENGNVLYIINRPKNKEIHNEEEFL